MELSNLKDIVSRYKIWLAGLLFVPAVAFATAFSYIQVDNIAIDVSTISSLNTNGDIILNPNGTGGVLFNDMTASTVPYLDANKEIASSAVTPTELGYLSGVTSAIQTQMGTKAPLASPTFTGTVTLPVGVTASRAVVTGSSRELAAATTTATEIGYVNGVTSAIQTQLDAKVAKSTYTAKGSLLAATAASTPANVSVGSDGTFLKADSSNANGVSWASVASAAVSYRATSGTDSILTSDDVVVWSGATTSPVLYTAVGNTGKVVTIIHNGTSLSQVYTLNTVGTETIGGVAADTYALYTNGESLRIISDGTNWKILDHKTNTQWVSDGTITITATTTAPTKGNTVTVDRMLWRRVGSNLEGRMEYKQTASTGSAAGTGDYLFKLVPTGATIDTTNYLTVNTGTYSLNVANSVGYGQLVNGTNEGNINLVVYDGTTARFVLIGDDTGGIITSAFYSINVANYVFGAHYSVPISGWQP